MAIIISAGRGVARVQTTTATPTLPTINAKMYSDWQAGAYAGLSLDSSMTDLADYLEEVLAQQNLGVYQNYAPYKNDMVRITVFESGTYRITWEFNGFLYGKRADGVIDHVSVTDVIATF